MAESFEWRRLIWLAQQKATRVAKALPADVVFKVLLPQP